MINGLDIPYKQLAKGLELTGSGLYLTGTNLKGGACNKKCNKKRTIKNQNGKRLKILK